MSLLHTIPSARNRRTSPMPDLAQHATRRDPAAGIDQPLTVLFDESPDGGAPLSEELRAVYGGDWRLPDSTAPYVYVNFAVTRDGRVSYSDPEGVGGGAVTDGNTDDRWVMALLRARADAVMVGDGTLRQEPDHRWTVEFIAPGDSGAFNELRAVEGRSAFPLQVIVTLDGEVPPAAAVFNDPALTVLLATTDRAAPGLAGLAGSSAAAVQVLAFPGSTVTLTELVERLRDEYRVRTLLCEGGPRLYGGMLAAGAVHDEFLTLCPKILGDGPERDGPRRPALVEGVAFRPGASPVARLLSARRSGDFMFVRSRWREAHHAAPSLQGG